MAKGIFHRTELLIGAEKLNQLQEKKVIIFGIGGVGSWCAESLIRSGITKLTIVDSDTVCITNVNRQLQATLKTVGQVKTEALKDRLLEINPTAEILTLQKIYCEANCQDFELDSYDFIIDAIDSLQNKIHLIQTATKTNAVFISAMGAALKLDPTRIKVDSFWKVKGCHLGRSLRKKLRKVDPPIKDFMCVYSDELLENTWLDDDFGNDINQLAEINNESNIQERQSKKAVINGSLSHITAIYGFTMAGLVMQKVYKENKPVQSFEEEPEVEMA